MTNLSLFKQSGRWLSSALRCSLFALRTRAPQLLLQMSTGHSWCGSVASRIRPVGVSYAGRTTNCTNAFAEVTMRQPTHHRLTTERPPSHLRVTSERQPRDNRGLTLVPLTL